MIVWTFLVETPCKIGLGDRVHQCLLDTGKSSKDLGLERLLVKLGYLQRNIAIPGHKSTVLRTVTVTDSSIGSLVRLSTGLLEGFQMHHEVQKPRDGGPHAVGLVGKINFEVVPKLITS
ncbi:hypothetical protein DSECCO2_404810 [anaerobic digester metagenome]